MADSFISELKQRVKEAGGATLNPQPAAQPAQIAPSSNQTTNSFQDELRSRLMPLTHAAVNSVPGGVTATPTMDITTLYGRREGADLVPIDQQHGIPVGDYWSIGFHSDPQSKADALQKLYPDKKVRILDTGDVTLEIDGAEGKRDVIINPSGIGKEDLIDLATQTPEIAASLAAFLATRGAGPLAAVARLVGSALAGGFAGEVKDVAGRVSGGIPVRPEDITKERGAQVAIDTLAGGALGLFGRYGSRILSPFAREVKEGSLAFNQRSGIDFLKRHFGLDFRSTAGERTGNPALLAVEAAESPMPGARNVMDSLRAERNRTIQEAQRIATGEVLPADEIGADAFTQLRNRVTQPLENAFMEARSRAIEKGDSRLLKLFNDVLGPASSRVTPEESGKVAAQAYQRRLTRAETAVNAAYQKVNELPGGTGDVLDGTAAADAAAAIRRELPAKTEEVLKPGALLDESGNPILQSTTQRTELQSGKPSGLEQALSDLESLRGSKVSLQTLTNMKKSAFDAIAAFKNAHGDVKERWFSQIAGAYERGIQSGIDATENLELKNALAAARDTYKKEMVPLERVGLRELAKTEFDPGHLSGTAILNRVFEGENAVSRYNMLEEVLGPNNVALRSLKRAYVDKKLEDAFDPILKTYDPTKLGAVLKQMKVDSPELAEKLVGRNYQPLMEALSVKEAMQKAGVEAIDEVELRTILNLKDPTVQDLRDVLRMGKRRNQLYVNNVFADIRDGALKDDFDPNRFVASLRDSDVSPKQLRDVLANLDTPTRDAIATSEFYRILNAASVREGETAAAKATGKPVNLSPTGIMNALGDTPEAREKVSILLADDVPAPGSKPPVIARGGAEQAVGANREQTLLALIQTLAPKEAAKTVFSGLGSIGSASAARQLTRGPLKYATGFAKNMFLATAYVKFGGKLLTNSNFDADAAAVVANTLIGSEPFLRASNEAFGPKFTKSMVVDIKSSIDRYVMELQDSPEGRRRSAAQRFIQGQNVPVKIETR